MQLPGRLGLNTLVVVGNLSRPGGNITGLSIMLAELSAKRLQLLKDAVPRVARVAALWNPPTGYHAKALENLKAALAAGNVVFDEASELGEWTHAHAGRGGSGDVRATAAALHR